MTNLFINSSPGYDHPKHVAKAVSADSNIKRMGGQTALSSIYLSRKLSLAGIE